MGKVKNLFYNKSTKDKIDSAMEEQNAEAKEREQRHNDFMRHMDVAIWSFIVLAAAIAFFFLLLKFSVIWSAIKVVLKILSPVFVGFALAYVLNPAVMALENQYMKMHEKSVAKKENKKEKKGNAKEKVVKEVPDDANPALVEGRKAARAFSVLFVVVVTVVLLTLLMIAVIPALINSVSTLTESMPEYADQLTDTVNKFINRHEFIKKQVPDFDSAVKKLNLYGRLEELLNKFVTKAADWVIIAFKIVYNVLVGLVVAIYLLLGKERFIGQMKKLTYSVMKPIHAKNFIQNMHSTNIIFKSSILGKIIDSIIIGLLCFVIMAVCGLCGMEGIADNKTLISIVVGVTNVIPFFGPFVGGIPSVFLIFCIKPFEGLVMAIIIIVLQQFDSNYLTPAIVGKSVGLSPFYVLVAILLGGGLFGVIGMLLAVPVGAVIYGYIKSAVESNLEEKKLPTKTNDYVMKPGARILWDMGERDPDDPDHQETY